MTLDMAHDQAANIFCTTHVTWGSDKPHDRDTAYFFFVPGISVLCPAFWFLWFCNITISFSISTDFKLIFLIARCSSYNALLLQGLWFALSIKAFGQEWVNCKPNPPSVSVLSVIQGVVFEVTLQDDKEFLELPLENQEGNENPFDGRFYEDEWCFWIKFAIFDEWCGLRVVLECDECSFLSDEEKRWYDVQLRFLVRLASIISLNGLFLYKKECIPDEIMIFPNSNSLNSHSIQKKY